MVVEGERGGEEEGEMVRVRIVVERERRDWVERVRVRDESP